MREEKQRLSEHKLPIFIETVWTQIDCVRFGVIIGIYERTRCTRHYRIKFALDGHIGTYRGAASRPCWIRHVFHSEAEYIAAQKDAMAKGWKVPKDWQPQELKQNA